MVREIVKPKSIWKYYLNFRKELDNEMHLIAENTDKRIKVYLTRNDLPTIIVEDGGSEIYSEVFFDPDNGEATVDKVYKKYLDPKDTEASENSERKEKEDDLEEASEIIDEREEQLDSAIYEFISEVIGEDDLYNDTYENMDEIIEDLKEHFLEYMAETHGILIYRPMFVENEDGTETYTEYPYEVPQDT